MGDPQPSSPRDTDSPTRVFNLAFFMHFLIPQFRDTLIPRNPN